MDLPERLPMHDILVSHAKRYPSWNEQDLYKLIHQAAMGNEHAITDEDEVRRWMERELQAMGEAPEEPLIENITPDGAVLRVHLRPLVKAGLNPEVVLRAFLDSSKVFQGSIKSLEEYTQTALEFAKRKELPFLKKKLTDYLDRMKTLHWPAVHHSQEFERIYRPAYRVVARAALPEEFFQSIRKD